MIAFDGVSVRYPGAKRQALTRVTLVAPAASLTAVVGPNGSGKSTLLRALLGRVPLQEGRVQVEGRDRAGMDLREFSRRAAVVVQREEPAFPLTVREFVALGRLPWHSLIRATVEGPGDHDAIRRAMDHAGVREFADRRTDSLSGGEWQRARLARALAQDTPLLAMDEPTTFLDIAHEMSLFERLSDLAGAGRTVLVVSHQLNLIARFAAHVVLLHEGQVAASGAPDEAMQGAILERVYHWPLVVSRDPAVGAPMLVPLRGGHAVPGT